MKPDIIIECTIDWFTKMDDSIPGHLEVSFNLFSMNELQYLESSLHTLRVAMRRESVRQAFRRSRTTLVKKTCIQFEYVSKPIYIPLFSMLNKSSHLIGHNARLVVMAGCNVPP